jgi:hypothetical protein
MSYCRNFKPSLFFIFLYLIRSHQQHTQCKLGQWPGNDGKCYECPSDFSCSNGLENPTQCPPNTVALPSSSKCCPANTKCPDGFAVDNNECTCVSLSCPSGMTMIQEFNRLYCQENDVSSLLLHKKCRPCAVGMTQNEQCYCFRIQGCGVGRSFWRSGTNNFSCLPHIR